MGQDANECLHIRYAHWLWLTPFYLMGALVYVKAFLAELIGGQVFDEWDVYYDDEIEPYTMDVPNVE